MRFHLAIIALVLTATQLPSHEVRAELPQLPLRADWVDDDVIAAPTAGGPDIIPQQLFGFWKVSLCVRPGMHRGHAWIRYENVHTGEIHTIGRFQNRVRPTRRRGTRETLYPRTTQAGLHWDYDWRFEHEVRQGKYLVGSVVVRDPIIYGHDDRLGHGFIRDNCITYARDAWRYYAGQQIDLAIIHTPEGFLRTLRHELPAETLQANRSNAIGIRAASRGELRRLPPIR